MVNEVSVFKSLKIYFTVKEERQQGHRLGSVKRNKYWGLNQFVSIKLHTYLGMQSGYGSRPVVYAIENTVDSRYLDLAYLE